MFRIVRSPHGKTTFRTAPQGKNRPHLLPGDHAGAPGNGDEGEMLHFLHRRETTHRWSYVPPLRETREVNQMADEMDAISETAKATQEIAKTAGQAIGATEKLGSFIARFISGPLEQGIGISKINYGTCDGKGNNVS